MPLFANWNFAICQSCIQKKLLYDTQNFEYAVLVIKFIVHQNCIETHRYFDAQLMTNTVYKQRKFDSKLFLVQSERAATRSAERSRCQGEHQPRTDDRELRGRDVPLARGRHQHHAGDEASLQALPSGTRLAAVLTSCFAVNHYAYSNVVNYQ